MKKKIIITLTALLCLSLLVFSYKRTNTSSTLSTTQIPSQHIDIPNDATSNTSKAYNKLISYKTEDYSSQSVAMLNRSLTYKSLDLSELLASHSEVMATISPEDKNYDFITLTLLTSLNELYCEQMGEQAALSGNVKKVARPIEQEETRNLTQEPAYEFVFYAFYNLNYDIIDCESLTVIKRDTTLQLFNQELQSYIDSLSETELKSSHIKKMISDKGDEIANNLSTRDLSLSCEISYVEIHNDGSEVQY